MIDETPVTPQMQQALMQEETNAVTPSDLESVKDMLGVRQLEEQNLQQAQMLQKMQSEAIYKDALAKTITTYPELTPQMLEAELARIEEADPNLAQNAKTPLGLEMIARGLKATITPNVKPDDVTDDGASSAQGGDENSELESLINSGKASKTQLGEFLGKLKS